ncbi:MAG: hypothetical protein SFY81_13530, partial [Verrucomicrobiota bacterium]|nr:hypothetical protein [Verrucomicrobiota bacterium]
RIELAERKQDHAERKLALAREKQELAAKKFALAQLKFQQKNQSQPLFSSNSSPNSTAPEAKANTPGHSQNTESQPLSIPSPALPASEPITLTPSFIEELAPSDSQTAHLKHPFTAENPFTPTAPPSQIAV